MDSKDHNIQSQSLVVGSRNVKLEVSEPIQAWFRCGCSYHQVAKDGRPAMMFDLYQRQAILTGRALAQDVGGVPAVDSIVKINGVLRHDANGPFVWVQQLEVVEAPTPDCCIFDLALPQWIVDQGVVDRARKIWMHLTPTYQQFINVLFAQRRTLKGFLLAPGSTRYHHNYDGGCLRHSVEAAEVAIAIANTATNLDRDLLFTAALIHDIGKSLEYSRLPSGRWSMSRYGKMVGHKISGVQLVTLAMARCPDLDAGKKEALLHILASSYAPSWAGFRAPATPEALALSAIDRICAGSITRH